MNETIRSILDRRSVRAYEDRQVDRETLEWIMRCTINAPSGMNRQNWHFSVAQDQALLEEFAKAYRDEVKTNPKYAQMAQSMAEDYNLFYKAPTVVVVSAEEGGEVNAALAIENMVVAAQSLGVGSVILGLPRIVFESGRGEEFIRRLKVREGYAPVLCVSLGYPAECPAAKDRDEKAITWPE